MHLYQTSMQTVSSLLLSVEALRGTSAVCSVHYIHHAADNQACKRSTAARGSRQLCAWHVPRDQQPFRFRAFLDVHRLQQGDVSVGCLMGLSLILPIMLGAALTQRGRQAMKGMSEPYL